MITEKNYKLANNLTGWFAFAVAAVTYLLTIEPTASFWDCGEFILSGYNLGVGHPPGAPFFMLTSRFFSLFAADASQVARLVNASSAIFSALTILFLFWTITHLAKKVLVRDKKDITSGQFIGILGAGLVGALAYAFSGSFWFSATEAEVYAFSSLFTAVVFWAILKWEDVSDKPKADHWIIFICYLMGLSVGVHLLNLLTIPVIFLVYYFKKYNATVKGTLIALGASIALLGIVMYGLIPGSVEMASWFELLFVNMLGMPFNSGVIVYVVAAIGILAWAILETYGKNLTRMKIALFLSVIILGIPFVGNGWFVPAVLIIALLVWLFALGKKMITPRLLNVAMLSMAVFFIGYLSYATIVIRSSANPPMDQNSPNNIFSLKSYLNREQYGDRPLFFGQYFNAELKLDERLDGCYPVVDEGSTIWTKDINSDKDRYMKNGTNMSYVYDDKFTTIFPRMYSPAHAEAYKSWGNIEGTPVQHERCGQTVTVMKPTFTENLRFFFSYQLNFMYWRYFMWNFSGRQNDIQGQGEVQNGNWITGLNFIDQYLVGDQTNLPADKANNKAHNKYYLLPFLLGIAGLVYQIYAGRRGMESFWLVGLLFFMTGIAIVLYLNQTPLQVRERDYAYVGSFYAFSIWIGFGVLALIKGLSAMNKNMSLTVKASLATLLALGVPVLMASENWDDNDRSGRYTMRDFGQNYLKSCEPNAIIFTNGDNDTFPLWYNQEVEKFRTDVRVCNLSYLQTDWYIDQMRRWSFQSAPLPINLPSSKYIQGVRDVSPTKMMIQEPLDLRIALEFFNNDSVLDDSDRNFMPSRNLYLTVDKDLVLKNGVVLPQKADSIVDRINITLGSSIAKNEYMVLQMLQDNDWKRPIYYATTVGSEANLGLPDYLQLEGLASRLVPIKQAGGSIDTERMFNNLMHKFKWGGIVENPNVYFDETSRRMYSTSRFMFSQLIQALIDEGKNEKALQATDYCLQVIPGTSILHNYFSLNFAKYYYQLGEKQKAETLMQEVINSSTDNLNWFFSLRNQSQMLSAQDEIAEHLFALQQAIRISQEFNPELSEQFMKDFLPYFQMYDTL
ncbi:MAG: DUF2723 domain-containing protein [Prevotellaceae bacterium]|jgi:hypothetical protein|nr:DUF2723 domain-containing protein [Prevotellaceae bacterium]